jgi:hypothetical protein
MPLHRRRLLLLLASAFVASCSGGSGGGSSATPGVATALAPTPAPTPVPPPSPTPSASSMVIQNENNKTAAQGVAGDWKISGGNYAANHEIEGYASATSVNRGESISLFVNTTDPDYTMTVYRIGWYGGQGGRRVAGPIQRSGVIQPVPLHTPEIDLIECDWTDPYVLSIPGNQSDPTDWASGVYLVKLEASGGKQSYIIFVVRDDSRKSDLLFQTSVTTYSAYSSWGGYDLYPLHSIGDKPAYKISFNRPYRNTGRVSFGEGAGDFLDWELHMVRFLEHEGFDVTYSTDIDTHLNGQRLLDHRAVIGVGHDEYWTKAMRDAFEAARDNGVNLGFFGANTSSWQIRMEPSTQHNQPDRTIVGYKDAAINLDPLYKTNPMLTTSLWRDPPINRPEASLLGSMTDYNSVDLDMIIDNCIDWICAGTGLQKGSVLKGMLGYEVDRIEPSSPSNVVAIASSPYVACTNPTCTTSDLRIANMTYYTAPSGAGVFTTGSMNWNWGLDAYGQYGDRANPAVQQITRNVLNRFTGH